MKHRHNRLAVVLTLTGAIAMAPAFAAAANLGGFSPPPTATPPDRSSPGDSAGKKTEGTTQLAPTGSPVSPPAGMTKPLKGPIQMHPSKVKKLSKPEPPPFDIKEVTDACKIVSNLGTYSYMQLLGKMKSLSTGCSTRAYSVQDQHAAGCKGNDTVDQCMEKLYDHCMSPSREKMAWGAPKEIEKVNKIVQAAQAYAKYVESMLNTYGK